MKDNWLIEDISSSSEKEGINYERDKSIVILNTDGRKMEFIPNSTIDAIVTDFPWKDDKAHTGTNQKNLVEEYKNRTFIYTKEDIEEKYRVLKEGAYCVEFFPQFSITNIKWMIEMINIFIQSGFEFQASVDWVKGKIVRISGREFNEMFLGQENYFNGESFDIEDCTYELIKSFKQNQGKKVKDGDQIFFFTKGRARNLKIDYKKIKKLLCRYAKNNSSYKDIYEEVFEKPFIEFVNKEFALKKVNHKFSGRKPVDIKGKLYNEFKNIFIKESQNKDIKECYCQSGTKYIIPARFIVPQVNKKIHDSEKPVELYKEIIKLVTKRDEIILDQFSGSGNLGIACREYGRKVILIEIDKEIFNKEKKNLFTTSNIEKIG